MIGRKALFLPLLLAAVLHPAPAAADACEDQCYQDYQLCYLFNPACEGVVFCTECEDQLQWCNEACHRVCYTDTCTSCSRPGSGTDGDADLVPDALEYDLAHRFFPNVYLQDYYDDLGSSYLGTGWPIPYTVQPYGGGMCDEDRECMEIRLGLAYRYDAGDPTWGGAHSGDSEFYAALVQRTAAWPLASADPAAWQLIRDFTAAHWLAPTDSSVVGAYGSCAPNCRNWDNNGSACQANSQCRWFGGLCAGMSNQPGYPCSYFWEEGECYFAGCTWYDSMCTSSSWCYATSPRTTQKDTYAAEGKHALYHSDSECDGGNIFNIDECPSNAFDMRAYKTGRLQNVGKWENHGAFDTIIPHPDGCNLYDVWGGAGFSNSTNYRQHFRYGFDWNLPAAAPPPSGATGNPFTYPTARDQYLSCYGMAGHISSNCRDVSDFNDKQMCYAMSDHTQSPCTSMTDRNLQLACYGMSIRYSSNCRDITDLNLQRFCYGVSGSDTSQCAGIPDTDTRQICYALATNNSSYCAAVSRANDRQFCYGASSHANSYCASIQ